RQHEERRSVDAGGIETQPEILICMDVFLGLEAKEEEAEEERRSQPDLHGAAVTRAQRVMRNRERDAARQQDGRVQRGYAPGRNDLELIARRAGGWPRVLEAFPQQHVREEVVALAREPGHRELARIEQRAEKRREERDLGE